MHAVMMLIYVYALLEIHMRSGFSAFCAHGQSDVMSKKRRLLMPDLLIYKCETSKTAVPPRFTGVWMPGEDVAWLLASLPENTAAAAGEAVGQQEEATAYSGLDASLQV